MKNVAWQPDRHRARTARRRWTEDWATLRDGQADVDGLLRALHEHGYDGWVTVEDFSTALPLEQRTADNLAYLHAIRERLTAHSA